MSSSRPPALAAWLLEHLTPGDKHDALVGDLLEEFQHGRSARWFWRQVLCAIPASLFHEMRAHWVARTVELGLTWVWVHFVVFYLQLFLQAKFWVMAFEPHARFFWRLVLTPGYPGHAWSALILLPVLLAAYLSARRSFNLLAFVCGLLIGVLVLSPVMFDLMRVLFASELPRGSVQWIVERWYLTLIPTTPIVVGIWAAQLFRRRSQAARIPS